MNIFRFRSTENRNNFVVSQPLLYPPFEYFVWRVITHLGFAFEFFLNPDTVYTFSYRWTLNTFCRIVPIEVSFSYRCQGFPLPKSIVELGKSNWKANYKFPNQEQSEWNEHLCFENFWAFQMMWQMVWSPRFPFIRIFSTHFSLVFPFSWIISEKSHFCWRRWLTYTMNLIRPRFDFILVLNLWQVASYTLPKEVRTTGAAYVILIYCMRIKTVSKWNTAKLNFVFMDTDTCSMLKHTQQL